MKAYNNNETPDINGYSNINFNDTINTLKGSEYGSYSFDAKFSFRIVNIFLLINLIHI